MALLTSSSGKKKRAKKRELFNLPKILIKWDGRKSSITRKQVICVKVIYFFNKLIYPTVNVERIFRKRKAEAHWNYHLLDASLVFISISKDNPPSSHDPMLRRFACEMEGSQEEERDPSKSVCQHKISENGDVAQHAMNV